MNIIRTVAVLAIISSVACGKPAAPVSMPSADAQGYSSLTDAAAAAETLAVTLSDKVEFGGALYQVGDQFYFTVAVSQQLADRVDYKIALPKGAKFAGMYHTHPNTSDTPDEFSESDIELAQKMNVPMFVGVVRYHHMLAFNPQTEKVTARYASKFFPAKVKL